MKNSKRLLTDEQLVGAVLRATRLPRTPNKTGWQAIAEDQDAKTLKAVGEWLANITASGNAVANELVIVQGIKKLMRGEMPD